MSKDKEYNEEEIIVGEYMEVSENGKEIVKDNMEKEDKVQEDNDKESKNIDNENSEKKDTEDNSEEESEDEYEDVCFLLSSVEKLACFGSESI